MRKHLTSSMRSTLPSFFLLWEFFQDRFKRLRFEVFTLCHLQNTPSHINKNKSPWIPSHESFTVRMREPNNVRSVQTNTTCCDMLQSREQKKCWHMLGKSLTGFKLDATYANIMQHSPTWCTNERNMLVSLPGP